MTTENHPENTPSQTAFIDFLILLARRKVLVVGLPIVAVFISMVVVLLLPNWYSATARILPPQQSQSNAVAILGQLGALAGGAGQALGIKNPSDVYVTMLKSRTVADKLVDRFDLMKVYDEDLRQYARRELAKHTLITPGREGVITIEVEDRDPTRAASVANAYVEELRSLTLGLAVSEASQRRLFFEAQLKRAKADLSTAELDLKSFTKDAGLVNPQGQIGLTVAAAAALRAQIAAKEIQLSAMRSFATESNPDLTRTTRELSGLRIELAKMEKDSNAGKGDVMVPFGKASEVGLEYVRRYRDMKYFETLFEILAKQYEIARIDEAKDATLIQVLDTAVPPERKSRPTRWLIVALSALFVFAAAVVLVLLLESFRRSMHFPEYADKIRQLREFLKTPLR